MQIPLFFSELVRVRPMRRSRARTNKRRQTITRTSKTRKSSRSRLSNFLTTSPLRMNEPGDADAEEVKHQHGRGEDAHVHDVGGRRHDGGDDEDYEDGVARVRPQEFRVDYAHER